MYRVTVFNLFLIIISIEMNLFVYHHDQPQFYFPLYTSVCTVCSTKDTISL
jgi:hypothetical protein